MTTLADTHPLIDTALPDSVNLETGESGLPRLVVDGPTGSAEIYLQGAHVTRWQPTGAKPVLWMSAASNFAEATPIRGGVPICFPWFGAHPAGPQHGWARITDWTLESATDDGTDVRLVFRLTDSADTRASAWPHRFEAHYEVVVGARLRLSLSVTNLEDSEITFEESLHTYFAVSDVRDAAVSGLGGLTYCDLTETGFQSTEPLRLTGPMTRTISGASGETVMTDATRQVRISRSNAVDTVVWNPWSEQAASMPDFGDDEWTDMICVETANVGSSWVQLPAGETHTLVTTYEVNSLR
ncbi:D-hexose-6-phosphate mutarotase [Okibacterium sp. HSC-33S16]|uniref:D-hexose-6-phosphate mutarotase n=1 Tax=Okibacterium sp. HSC-33S16 TaxID=2910965 RepID=UPI00209D1D61|nr:D-hexose-6-phosphate mutarotase [Okibacterium sp. HSC-33S16]MCP2032103.1 D-hexose-6-phosphate mutarotase [Okibacterium sp. HSC-33S16]